MNPTTGRAAMECRLPAGRCPGILPGHFQGQEKVAGLEARRPAGSLPALLALVN